ncbi:MAG: hypothetical protein PHN72_01265 [Bacilli bacterium]|nr:hypothetical protein [Bacilli bacterium]
MQNTNLEVINAEIISQRHLDLILEKFLLKRIYDKNEISYYVYEQIKKEIDKEVFQIIEHFKNIHKNVDNRTHSPKQSYNEGQEEEENDA